MGYRNRFNRQQISTFIDQYGPESIAFYVSGQLLTGKTIMWSINLLKATWVRPISTPIHGCVCLQPLLRINVLLGKTQFQPVIAILNIPIWWFWWVLNTAWCHPVLYQRIMKAKEERDLFRRRD